VGFEESALFYQELFAEEEVSQGKWHCEEDEKGVGFLELWNCMVPEVQQLHCFYMA
jgi:hypothetical protein